MASQKPDETQGFMPLMHPILPFLSWIFVFSNPIQSFTWILFCLHTSPEKKGILMTSITLPMAIVIPVWLKIRSNIPEGLFQTKHCVSIRFFFLTTIAFICNPKKLSYKLGIATLILQIYWKKLIEVNVPVLTASIQTCYPDNPGNGTNVFKSQDHCFHLCSNWPLALRFSHTPYYPGDELHHDQKPAAW